MIEKEYIIHQNSAKLELTIPSRKSLAWKIAIIFQIMLFLGLIIISLLILANNFSLSGLVLGGLLIFLSIYCIKLGIDTYFWIQKGREYLKIDLNTHTFIYQKIGRSIFDEINGKVNDLSKFKGCPENDDYIDEHPRAGTRGGKICFWVNEKRYRFGIALSTIAAHECITELNSFLSSKKHK